MNILVAGIVQDISRNVRPLITWKDRVAMFYIYMISSDSKPSKTICDEFAEINLYNFDIFI